jgi:hypothetical protein
VSFYALSFNKEKQELKALTASSMPEDNELAGGFPAASATIFIAEANTKFEATIAFTSSCGLVNLGTIVDILRLLSDMVSVLTDVIIPK